MLEDIDEDLSGKRIKLQVDYNNLESALKFFMEYSKQPIRDINKEEIRDSLKIFSIMSKKGIPEQMIKSVAVNIVFSNVYDISVRRSLLYCLIPEQTFPHSIIPLAVSTALVITCSHIMRHSILSWFGGLLEYGIIDSSNKYVHMCYTALFHLLSNEKICGLICKILYRITQRYDVSPYRIATLKRLIKKPNLKEQIHPLLRLYKTYRPDLVIVSITMEKKFPEVSSLMRESMLLARERIEQNLEGSEDNIWSQIMQIQKKSSKRNVLPLPEIYDYSATLEEKSRKKIYVLQYRKIRDMAKDIRRWKDWVWPNSATSLLRKPSLISLFKPGELEPMITITNWLEMALKTEIIHGRGRMSMKQKENLLSACVSLCRQTNTMIPIVYHFIGEFLILWDKQSFMGNVLELLSCIPFTSDTYFFDRVMNCLVDLFCTVKLMLWCDLVNAFSYTACVWAFQEYKGRLFKTTECWPLAIENLTPMEGALYLTKRLERIFLAGLNRFGTESMLLHTCIDYYEKLNMCSEELELQIYMVPPIEFVVAVIASGDVGAMHRLGVFYSKSKMAAERLRKIVSKHSLANVFVRESIQTVNESVEVFLNFTFSCMAFNSSFMEIIKPYFTDEYMNYLAGIEGLNMCACIANSVSYLPISLLASDGHELDSSEQVRITLENTLKLLASRKLNGIDLCKQNFITD